MATFKVGSASNRKTRFSILSAAKQSRVWKRVVLGLLIVIPVSVISGIAANAFREQGIALVPEYMRNRSLWHIKHIALDSESAEGLEGLLVDARPNHLYEDCHAPEASNFPPGKFDFFYGLRFSGISKKQPIFVYGRTYSRAYDEELAYRLSLKGHRNITVVPLRLSCL